MNLFFLRNEQKLEILEEVYAFSKMKPDDRVAPLIKVHEKWMKIAPFAFKNFEERRIMGISEVCTAEWGMIPLLRDYLFGTFNPVALNEDFQKENSQKNSLKRKQKQEVSTPEKIEEETVSDTPVTVDFDFDDDI